jgi:hypothetical protein
MFPVAIGHEKHDSAEPASLGTQALRFALHLAAVYLIVWFITPWIAGRIHWAVRQLDPFVERRLF